MNRMDEVKPCPFCGGSAALALIPGVIGKCPGWIVSCNNNCCLTFPELTAEAAANKWNKRNGQVQNKGS